MPDQVVVPLLRQIPATEIRERQRHPLNSGMRITDFRPGPHVAAAQTGRDLQGRHLRVIQHAPHLGILTEERRQLTQVMGVEARAGPHRAMQPEHPPSLETARLNLLEETVLIQLPTRPHRPLRQGLRRSRRSVSSQLLMLALIELTHRTHPLTRRRNCHEPLSNHCPRYSSRLFETSHLLKGRGEMGMNLWISRLCGGNVLWITRRCGGTVVGCSDGESLDGLREGDGRTVSLEFGLFLALCCRDRPKGFPREWNALPFALGKRIMEIARTHS